MDTKDWIRFSLSSADFIVDAYLGDIKEAEMFARAVPGTNHLAWQIGHLISSERWLADKAAPGKMPELPAGFAEKHNKETAAIDDPASFLNKEEYLKLRKEVRAGTLALIDSLSPADFDKPVEKVPPMLKNAAQTLHFIGAHWTMHAGQWAVLRRKLGRAPLF
jgi:hypothetical protein